MTKHLPWIVPALITAGMILGALYMDHQRMEILAKRHAKQLKWEQNVEDRLDVLEYYCCSELCPEGKKCRPVGK